MWISRAGFHHVESRDNFEGRKMIGAMRYQFTATDYPIAASIDSCVRFSPGKHLLTITTGIKYIALRAIPDPAPKFRDSEKQNHTHKCHNTPYGNIFYRHNDHQLNVDQTVKIFQSRLSTITHFLLIRIYIPIRTSLNINGLQVDDAVVLPAVSHFFMAAGRIDAGW